MFRIARYVLYVILLCGILVILLRGDPGVEGRGMPLLMEPKTLSTWNPKKPYYAKLLDIDGDNEEEVLCSFLAETYQDKSYLALFDLGGNFAGWQLPIDEVFREFSCIDVENDGVFETFVSITEGKDAYLSMYRYRQNQPSYRIEPSRIPSDYRSDNWDGYFLVEKAMDINNDESIDIVIMAKTGWDIWPRGIYVFDFESKGLVWEFPMGALPYELKIEDIDGDNDPEFLIGTAAVSNGANINGTTDSLSYLIVLNNQGEPRLINSLGEYGSDIRDIHVCDIDQDQEEEVIILRREQTSEKPSEIFVFNSKTLDIENQSVNAPYSKTLILTDLDSNGKKEIVCGSGKSLIVFDGYLRKLKEKMFNMVIQTVYADDIDFDGQPELLLLGASKLNVINNNLKLMGTFNFSGKENSRLIGMAVSREGTKHAIVTADKLYFVSMQMAKIKLLTNIWVYLFESRFLILILIVLSIAGLESGIRVQGLVRNFRTLVKSLIIDERRGIIYLDPKQHILNFNRAAERILQTSRRISQKFDTVIPQDRRDNIMKIFTQLEESKQAFISEEFLWSTQEGVKNILISIRKIQDSRNRDKGYIITLEDITDLTNSKRIAAWGAMAQRLAHKMKNPLSAMRFALQRLQTVSHETLGTEADKLDRYIEASLYETNRLMKLPDSFIKFADLELPKFMPVDVNRTIKDVLDRYTGSFSSGIELKTDLGENLPKVRADQTQLFDVLENLVTNALGAMGRRGILHIRSLYVRIGKKNSILAKEKEYVHIEVSDTGIGIPEEDIDKLFDPFYSKTEGGTGLGLALVKKIVDDHEGIINVDSTVGEGTIFTVSFPVWKKECL